MQIIEWADFLENTSHIGEKPLALSIGVFDGVHRGHQALIEMIVSHNKDSLPAVITFRQNHHRKKKHRPDYPGDITSFRQKTAIFEKLDIALVIVIDFSESFRHMPGADFLHLLQHRGNMQFLAVGSNFRCGYQLDTDAAAIQKINAERDISTGILQPLQDNAGAISSSRIRSAIAGGDLQAAQSILGYPFTIDLGGAPTVSANGKIAYDIAALERILPPPGKYSASLKPQHGAGGGTQTEILVDGGKVLVNGELGKSEFEFVEFKS